MTDTVFWNNIEQLSNQLSPENFMIAKGKLLYEILG